jgi:hypothetical protein
MYVREGFDPANPEDQSTGPSPTRRRPSQQLKTMMETDRTGKLALYAMHEVVALVTLLDTGTDLVFGSNSQFRAQAEEGAWLMASV